MGARYHYSAHAIPTLVFTSSREREKVTTCPGGTCILHEILPRLDWADSRFLKILIIAPTKHRYYVHLLPSSVPPKILCFLLVFIVYMY